MRTMPRRQAESETIAASMTAWRAPPRLIHPKLGQGHDREEMPGRHCHACIQQMEHAAGPAAVPADNGAVQLARLGEFQFCALQCKHVSEHEAIIISLVCGLRESRPATVRQTLDLLVEEEAVGDLILALSHLGKAMDEAGVELFGFQQVTRPLRVEGLPPSIRDSRPRAGGPNSPLP